MNTQARVAFSGPTPDVDSGASDDAARDAAVLPGDFVLPPVNAGLDKYLNWITSETSLAIS